MELVSSLESSRDEVVRDASRALTRAHLPHYDAAGPQGSFERVSALFDLVLVCLRGRTLVPVASHAQRVAEERFTAGYDIAEVQTAFNVLEETIWRVVIARLAPEHVVEAAGMIGTVLGAGKDTLARSWVSLATRQHVPTLDLAALFDGAAS